MNSSPHSHQQKLCSTSGDYAESRGMMSRRRHHRSKSNGYESGTGNDAPSYYNGVDTDNNCEAIKCSPPLSNNLESSDENRDAESTASGSDKSETDQRRRLRQVVAQFNDCWETKLSNDDNNHTTANNHILRWRQSGEKEVFMDDTLLPRMDQNNSSFHSSDIFPNNSIHNNDSGMSLPEQILQHRLQRKPKLQCNRHGNLVRYQSKSPEQRQRAAFAGFTCDAPAGYPPFSEEESEADNASTVASSNGASNDYSDLRRRLKLQTDNQVDDVHDTSPLDSLPQRPICPFPDEADRKRIVGCLAVVLACSYAYETAPHLLVKEAADMAVRVSGSDAECLPKRQFSDPESIPDNSAVPDIDTERNREVGDESTCTSPRDGISTHPHLTQHKMQQHLIELSRKQKHTSISCRNSGNSSGNLTAKNTSSSASSIPSFSFNANAATRIFDKVGTQNPPASLSSELAEIRHRIRRHAIMSELLISSAEMLLLDPSHAKAFLPMLDGLLTKVEATEDTSMDSSGNDQINSDEKSRQSWKGRGFGGGGLPVASEEVDNTTIPPSEPTVTDIPLRMTQLICDAHGPPSSERESFNETISSDTFTNTSHEGGVRASINTRETRPSSLRVNLAVTSEDHCNQSRNTPTYAPLETAIIEADLVAPFLQTLTPGAGFRCIALLLLNHLLRDGRGYDARVRHAFKRLAVVVIAHELKVGGILCVDLDDDDDDDLDALLWGNQTQRSEENEYLNDANELALLATRKFEALEHAIAAKLISLSAVQDSAIHTTNTGKNNHAHSPRVRRMKSSASSLSSSTHGRIALAPKETPTSSHYGMSREQLLRGIKVGTAGAVGATLFALTGGLAAPGIAAGLAAVVGTSAIAAGVSTALTSAAAITTIFGVGGAGLASYKMHRRTKGLTEFNFNKEAAGGDAELFSTICISGWLRDSRDFQRPWGVSPSHPRIVDRQELLERFYFIHNPDNVFRVSEILKHWKGRYFQLWRALGQKYGRDPSNLFPLKVGPRISAELTHEEGEAVDFLLKELGYSVAQKRSTGKPSNFEAKSGLDDELRDQSNKPRGSTPVEAKKLYSAQQMLKESSLRPKKWLPNSSDIASSLSLFSESETNSIHDTSTHTVESVTSVSSKGMKPAAEQGTSPPPKHLLTVWDYHANYGGELYTVQWESELLMELCDSVTDQMIEWGISATRTILHTTVFATLMTAVTIPYSLVLAANTIDSSWTMAMERADRAGIELAKSLIDSIAGHRPVTLVGFSMGARVIYSCLKELARHQEIWEAHQQRKRLPFNSRRKGSNGLEESRDEDHLKYIREPASIIEDCILMGTPNHVSTKSWEACRRVVAGRMINCYSRKDYILSLMFQLKRFQGILRPVCGTSPVSVNGVENYDVTELVSTHTDYCYVSGEILKRIRHGQPQRASELSDVSAMVTTIKIAGGDIDALPLFQNK